MKARETVNSLLEYAYHCQVSDVKIVSAQAIAVEDHLAKMCETPRCDGYGQTVNCPPHGMTVAQFRADLGRFDLALVFKYDVATEILLSDDRHEFARKVHATAGAIERHALRAGCRLAQGLAAGSCKPLFCDQFDTCRALVAGKSCRFPNQARPSMSGLGINFFKLCEVVGWPIHKITPASDPAESPTGLMAGMVLISLDEAAEPRPADPRCDRTRGTR